MTARDFLEQYEEMDRRIRRLEAEIREQGLMIDAVRSPSDNDGMPHGNGVGDPTADRAIKIADKRLELVQAKMDAIDARQMVYDVIEMVGGFEADVLKARFVDLLTWENVCIEVHYSWPTVRDAWHRGEDKVQEIIDTRNYNHRLL